MRTTLLPIHPEATMPVPSKRRLPTPPELDRAFWCGDGASNGHLLTIVAPEGVSVEPMRFNKPSFSHSELLRVIHYNPQTGAFTWKVTLSRKRIAGRPAGGFHKKTGYHRIRIHKQQFQSHRLAWFYVHGFFPLGLIDHRDGDSGNNRISNLRLADHGRNSMNGKVRSNNTSGVKGVSFVKSINKWAVLIKSHGKAHWGGRFSSFDEAAAKASTMREKLHGEFARHA